MKIYVMAVTYFVFTLLFSGCADWGLTPEERMVRDADRRMDETVREFRDLGIYYQAERLREPLLAFRNELLRLKDAVETPEAAQAIDAHLLHLTSFMGLLVFNAFYDGPVVTTDAAGERVELNDVRLVGEEAAKGLDFFPLREGNYLWRQDIEDFYRALIDRDPEYSFSYSALAMFVLSLRRFDEAISLCDHALSLNENDFFALRTLVVALSHSKTRLDELDDYINRFKRVSKNRPFVNHLVSQVAMETGDIDKAIRYGEKSISKVRSAAFIVHLAKLYEMKGDLKRARHHYASLLAMGKFGGERFYDYAEAQVERLKGLMAEGKAARDVNKSTQARERQMPAG